MTWHEAIEGLERQVTDWAPEGVDIRKEPWREDPTVNVLVLHRADGRQVTLEPAWWKREEVPTAADLYSSRGPRVRLQGPYPEGEWRVLSSDLFPLRIDWTETAVDGLLNDLLNV